MKIEFDLLVYLSLVFLTVSFVFCGYLIRSTPDGDSLEVRKIRLSAAMFTGIMVVFLFSAMLYYASNPSQAAAVIFEKGVTAMTPLAGAMMGYLFGTRSQR